jgi:aminoglycoside 3-N-acetyltransferase
VKQVDEMIRDLRHLGINPGGVLLVHSSFKALGPVEGGVETVIQGLLGGLGEDGTLLLPALSYASVTAENPVFDIRNTSSCIGAIPEYFRTRQGTHRSMHPTHSVCGVGRLWGDVLGKHFLDDTPCGRYSPFHLLPEVHGQILMLGCGLAPNTSMHAIEELVIPPYLYAEERTYILKDEDGIPREKVYRPHNFRGWAQRYDRVGSIMSGEGLKTGLVLRATAYLLDTVELWDRVYKALKGDALSFVEKI